MSRAYDDHPDDDDDGYDDPDDSDDVELPDGVYHDDDESVTVACPNCQAEIFEGAQWCPHCEHHLSKEEAPPEKKSRFWLVMMALALFCAAVWAGFF